MLHLHLLHDETHTARASRAVFNVPLARATSSRPRNHDRKILLVVVLQVHFGYVAVVDSIFVVVPKKFRDALSLVVDVVAIACALKHLNVEEGFPLEVGSIIVLSDAFDRESERLVALRILRSIKEWQ